MHVYEADFEIDLWSKPIKLVQLLSKQNINYEISCNKLENAKIDTIIIIIITIFIITIIISLLLLFPLLFLSLSSQIIITLLLSLLLLQLLLLLFFYIFYFHFHIVFFFLIPVFAPFPCLSGLHSTCSLSKVMSFLSCLQHPIFLSVNKKCVQTVHVCLWFFPPSLSSLATFCVH